MKNAVRKYRVPFLALVGMMVLGLTVGAIVVAVLHLIPRKAKHDEPAATAAH